MFLFFFRHFGMLYFQVLIHLEELNVAHPTLNIIFLLTMQEICPQNDTETTLVDLDATT